MHRGRGREPPPNSTLPSWNPRTPLSDTTLISRAFARRRARLEEAQVHETDSLLPAGPSPLKPFLQLSGAPLEHEPSLVTPSPSPSVDTDNPAASDNCPPPVSNISKILADIADQPVASDNSECFVGNVCEITDSQTSLLQVMTLSSLQVICSYQVLPSSMSLL
ncbi:protein POLYCHOME-like [Punica granatum]|uniref:Protein POLYCHOME-like n=1 Tax=Punica granatum TaxID=22663 RepID=A0A6P8ECV3_PUNGR|nr:protein POLYCHOME-like [Punica granatum]